MDKSRHQGMERLNVFIRAFRERLIDCRWRNWEDPAGANDICSMYRNVNSISHCTKTYITMNMDRHLKRIMIIGVSELFLHYHRYRKIILRRI